MHRPVKALPMAGLNHSAVADIDGDDAVGGVRAGRWGGSYKQQHNVHFCPPGTTFWTPERTAALWHLLLSRLLPVMCS